MSPTLQTLVADANAFSPRHLSLTEADRLSMLVACGAEHLEALIEQAVPSQIRRSLSLNLPAALGEDQAVEYIRQLAAKNEVYTSMIGQGYSDCVTPPVIARNILENPGWYTQYTPYQAEISQGRLEALINFQTMVADLTGLPMTNSSLLDEGTAAAEAMTMSYNADRKKRQQYFVSDSLHPQTIAVLKTRAEPLSIQLVFGAPEDIDLSAGEFFGAILQYPNTFGDIEDYADFCARAHEHNCLVTVACDLLALTLLTPPGEFGADIAVGNSQRFGVPLGGGGPHAGFFATKEQYRRQMPGRIIGVSKDADGRPAYRLTLQTREQHIRRDKATSNICTAQVLLAVMAGMYAVYHGAGAQEHCSSGFWLDQHFASSTRISGH